MKKCINEYYLICTQDTRIMVAEFDDGTIEKEYEYHLISKERHEVKYICHTNKDKIGNRYTTEKTLNLSEYGWKSWLDEYSIHHTDKK